MNSAVTAISLSVLMHVSWNLLARHVDSRCNYLWWGLLTHLVLLGPWALWRFVADSHWDTRLVVAMLVTAGANTVYFLALRKAYHFASVALVYPIVRSSPIFIAIWAWLIFDQGMTLSGIAGICINTLGLWILAGSTRDGDAVHALPWAIFAALATSVYSLSDKVAINYLPTFGAQLGFITVGYAASFVGLSIFQYRKTNRIRPECRPKFYYLLPGGLFIGTAYALVVRAMQELPASYVVAYTNAGIVLATIFSIWIFKERENWVRRLLAAVVISLGLIVLGINI